MICFLASNRLARGGPATIMAALVISAVLLFLSGRLQLWNDPLWNGRLAILLGVVFLIFVPVLRWHLARGKSGALFQPVVNRALLLLVAWAGLSLAAEILNGGRTTDFAVAEWLRLASGAAIYFVAMHWSRWGMRLSAAGRLVLAGSAVFALVGWISYLVVGEATAGLGNRQLLGGILALAVPFAVVRGQTCTSKGSAAISWVVAGGSLFVLLLTSNRTSWIAVIAGLRPPDPGGISLVPKTRKPAGARWLDKAFPCRSVGCTDV